MVINKKAILLLCIFAMTCIRIYAQNLILTMKSGSNICIKITDCPKITLENGIMSIGTERLHIDNIKKYQFKDLVSSTEKIKIDFQLDVTHIDKGRVIIENYTGQNICMHNINGIKMPIKTTINNNKAFVDFSKLPAAPYILAIGKESIKIIKR